MTEVITVTREDLLASRQRILSRLGLTLADTTPERCGCCPPAGVEIPWRDWDALREIAFLLGEDA
jgi:hypothetical protein